MSMLKPTGPNGGPYDVAEVVNNNQPDWLNTIKTAPNVTLNVGDRLMRSDDAWKVICGVRCERDELLIERNELVERAALWSHVVYIKATGAAFGPFMSESAAQLWAIDGAAGLEYVVLGFKYLFDELPPLPISKGAVKP